MSTLADAIFTLAPGAAFSFKDDDLTTLVWNSPSIPQPSNDAILAEKAKFDAALPLTLLRKERDYRLMQTDWVGGSDVPQELKTKWMPYRQALRDITDTYTSLADVVWPVKPE